jgi:taurine dioxygenase
MPVLQQIKVHRLGGHLGATVSGVNLAENLPNETIADIRSALLKHVVLFFRDQHDLDDERQVAFTARFGEVTGKAHPTSKGLDEHPEISSFDSEGNGPNFWHTDATFVQRPPALGVLRAVVLPSAGGDTAWANTASAYESLPAGLRELADRLWAVHSNRYVYADPRGGRDLPPVPEVSSEDTGGPSSREWTADFNSPAFETIHPVVRVHPETGQRSLLLGVHCQHLVGYSAAASSRIRTALQRYVGRPENTVRWRWRLGDVAFSDNRTSQHYAVGDYNLHRVMHRVATIGDAPVSVDGRISEARVGDLQEYVAKTDGSYSQPADR